MRRQLDELITRPFGFTPLPRLFQTEFPTYEPPVDLYETNEGFQAMVPVPGFPPEEIHVNATKDTVVIYGERKALIDEDKVVAHRKEGALNYNRFNISFTLPCEIEPNKVSAVLENGMLKIRLPRVAEAKPAGVKIEVVPGK
jgi:Molecular chaperone (small heat shock protein)